MIYIFLFLTVVLFYALYEYRNIKKVHLTYKDFDLIHQQNLKIIYLSDIQYDFGPFFHHKLMQRVIDMIEKETPDLVLLGGDYIHEVSNHYHVFDYLKKITAPKIGILGNHDYKDVEGVKKACENAKIELLINEVTQFENIQIIGLDDLREGNPKIPEIDPRFMNILLIHEPDDFENYLDNHQFDVTLAGHLHGGQVNLFGKYAPILPSKYGQRYVYGLIKRKNQSIYVTRGLGGFVFFLPLRFFANPEIVILEL